MTATKKKKTKKSTTRKKKTKKKVKKTSRGKERSKKQPKWKHITFKKIEAARAELGLTKVDMAKLLGATNSTYHNWRKGEAVPHETSQEAMVKAITKAHGKKAKAKARGGVNGNGNGHGPRNRIDFEALEAPSKGTGRRGTLDKVSRVPDGGHQCDDSTGVAEQSHTRVTTPKVPPEVSTLALLAPYLANPSSKVSAGSVPKLVRETMEAFSA